MMWAVVDVGDSVHVVPELDDGDRMFHVMASDCLCSPLVEHHRRPFFEHHAMSEQPNRRYVMRAWNLRRMLRGRRGGIR